MANVTIYPFGISGEQPGGAWPQKMADIQATLDLLAPLAFRDTPNPANPPYNKVGLFPTGTYNDMILRYGESSTMNPYILSPIYDLGDIGDSITLEFSCGEAVSSGNFPCLLFFNEDMQPCRWYVATATPRIETRVNTADTKFCRLLFKAQYLLDAYIKLNDNYLFNGADLPTSSIRGKEAFAASQYWLGWGPNSRGDWIGWNFTNSTSAATAQRTDITNPLYRFVGTAATTIPYSISKVVELPKNVTINVEFSCGVVNADLMLRVLNPSAGTANYYAANANPRTVSINTATYTHVQLYFLTANYADCYIKDATNNVILWQGAASTD